jgi:hypothetical protein
VTAAEVVALLQATPRVAVVLAALLLVIGAGSLVSAAVDVVMAVIGGGRR